MTTKWFAEIKLILISAFILLACEKSNETPIYLISSNSNNLPKVSFPVKHISTLAQCPHFVNIQGKLYYQHKTGDTTSVFQILSDKKQWTSKEDSKLFLKYDYVQLTPANTYFAFRSYYPQLYQINRSGEVLNKYSIPLFFDLGLKDTVVQYIHGSVSLMPQSFDSIMPFRLYERLIREPVSLEEAIKAKYHHNIFLSYNIANPAKSEVFGTLPQLGFHYKSQTEDDYNNMETKFTFYPFRDKFLVISSKSEEVSLVNKNGDVIKLWDYFYAKNTPDFKLKNSFPDPAEYYTQCAVYLQNWVDTSGNYLIRVLKRGKSSKEQLDQTETPWEVIILSINEEHLEIKQIFKFEPAHFNYGDVHFVDNRYLFISNKGIKNGYYDPENHSYSILDLSKYLE